MWAQVALAYLVDLAFGEPKRIPHPISLIGRLISYLERLVFEDKMGWIQKRCIGAAVVLLVVAISASTTWAIVYLAHSINEWIGFVVSVLLISTTIATKGLMDSAKDIASSLGRRSLAEARRKVSQIVGRDTENMKRKDIVRATIESVAENSVDGVIAPIIYAVIGGAPLAMAYKAINTLDSMIGYKNERYRDFGWAAAKLDDIANYIPARVSVLILAISALICRKDAWKALKIAIRDGRNHESPNSGWPEAAVAGAVGVKLGGKNYYAGVARKTGPIGDGKGPMTGRNINEVVWLVFVASAMTILISRAALFAADYIKGL
ncbi:MAG: adenosylcobinamide-phosphate synthase CbiB [Firmicutes bacterium]|nr:adenosylcobinamide-phosphate synthase CbiB [Bacillota bacterium]